jgi:hypothetical protein
MKFRIKWNFYFLFIALIFILPFDNFFLIKRDFFNHPFFHLGYFFFFISMEDFLPNKLGQFDVVFHHHTTGTENCKLC